MQELFLEELADIYNAEQQLTKALPKMAKAASSPELKAGFAQHLTETENQLARLEGVCAAVGCKTGGKTCEAMKGLIEEGEGMIKASGDPDTRDAALIAAAQKVEHYEIASYGTVRTYAQELRMNDVAQILQQTLEEEGETDKRLTRIAESRINLRAQAHA